MQIPDHAVQSILDDCLSMAELDAMHAFWGRVDGLLNDAGVAYWADSGTLIGAIRHEGIIPWDDDIDIALPAEGRVRLRNEQWRFEDEGFVIDWDRAWPKIWHQDGRSISSHKHRWPFVDLFFLEERDTKAPSGARIKAQFYAGQAGTTWPAHKYLQPELFPLQRVPFGDDEIWAPNQSVAVLDRLYLGWRDTVDSGNYNHRLERIKQPVKAPMQDVAEAYEARFGRSLRLASD